MIIAPCAFAVSSSQDSPSTASAKRGRIFGKSARLEFSGKTAWCTQVGPAGAQPAQGVCPEGKGQQGLAAVDRQGEAELLERLRGRGGALCHIPSGLI